MHFYGSVLLPCVEKISRNIDLLTRNFDFTIPFIPPTRTMVTFVKTIRLYFSLGLKHNEVLSCLAHIRGIVISLRTVRRHLKSFGLCRRKNSSDPLNVALFFTKEVSAGRTHGYKLHHFCCIQHGYCVS